MTSESPSPTESNPYRCLPAVDELLREPRWRELGQGLGRGVRREIVAAVLERWRGRIAREGLDAETLRRRFAAGELERELEGALRREAGRGILRAINATGVVLHTGLGRAPVAPRVAAAMAEAAASYCVLEVDRYSGERNERDQWLAVLCRRLFGCEAAIAVNNNAAAALLMVQTFGRGREVVVSRGEQVEIGGSFRVPEILAAAGARLVEVGTTNRTRLSDYEEALTPQTGLLLKVHRSNFRLVGFQEEVSMEELARLGRDAGVVSAFDLGSGRVECPGAPPLERLEGETQVREAVASGLDVISFSGDKLFGGPQAGLIVGRREAVAQLRRHALYRALRLDKSILRGLEETLRHYLSGRAEELPTRAMMLKEVAQLRRDCERIAAGIERLGGYECALGEAPSEAGSGSAPGVSLPSVVVKLRHRRLSVDELANRLRAADPPLFARIRDDGLWLDPRTLLPGDEQDLLSVLASIRP